MKAYVSAFYCLLPRNTLSEFPDIVCKTGETESETEQEGTVTSCCVTSLLLRELICTDHFRQANQTNSKSIGGTRAVTRSSCCPVIDRGNLYRCCTLCEHVAGTSPLCNENYTENTSQSLTAIRN